MAGASSFNQGAHDVVVRREGGGKRGGGEREGEEEREKRERARGGATE